MLDSFIPSSLPIFHGALWVQRTLDAIAGADLNPYAIAIARFRLLVAALHASGIRRLADARDYKMHLAVADSLLHGKTWGARTQSQMELGGDNLGHVYRAEDKGAIDDVLGHRYHVVVGNPPYVTVKDPTLNAEYRRYGSCRGKYSLAVPFTERFFDLALSLGEGAGYIGMITSNSFMKREFGKTLIEKYLPRWDLTHAIDTSGAYIPNHGTPTVILFARNRAPIDEKVRTVMGIRGEPSTPEDPAEGKVWTEIIGLVNRVGETGDFVSVSDVERGRLAKHPWSIGGGGAAELKELLDEAGEKVLADVASAIGVMAVAGNDDVFIASRETFRRARFSADAHRVLVIGDSIRDWSISETNEILFPHDYSSGKFVWIRSAERYLWNFRTELKKGIFFGKVKEERGLNWRELAAVLKDKLGARASIAFAFVATHNHFVFDRGGKVFNRTAPVIKLSVGADHDEHLALIGLLNSSIGGFWQKAVCHCKGAQGVNEGGKSEKWEQFYEFSGTKKAHGVGAHVGLAAPGRCDRCANSSGRGRSAASHHRRSG